MESMRTVLITGAEGFIGKHLRAALRDRRNLRIDCFDVQDDPAALDGFLDRADFVFHLAGVTRPADPGEFQSGNTRLTERITRRLIRRTRPVPVALSSSAQAALDNPYGVSKRQAEAAVFEYGRATGAAVYVFRLPNVFGKWCRPDYNSCVATFCHHIAHDLPIQVNDCDTVLNLVYIEDVVRALADLLDGEVKMDGAFCVAEPVYAIRLGKIAELIRSFRKCSGQKSAPDMSDAFVGRLYSTYISYLPESRRSVTRP